ncbi:uncharacterized protein Tco025E_05152, partial [Trypanosoma conorhini]
TETTGGLRADRPERLRGLEVGLTEEEEPPSTPRPPPAAPLAVWEEERGRLTAFEEAAAEVSVGAVPPDVELFSRHTRWLAGRGWHAVCAGLLRDALLSDFAASSGRGRAAVDVAVEADGLRASLFVACDDPARAREIDDFVSAAELPAARHLLSLPHACGLAEVSGTACVQVRCLFERATGAVLWEAPATQRTMFVLALEVDLLMHAAAFGASHLALGSRILLNSAKALALRCRVLFPTDAQAEVCVQSLQEDDGAGGIIYCRQARRAYASLGGEAREVAVAVVSPLPL